MKKLDDLHQLKQQLLAKPAVKQAYDALEDEFTLINLFIDARLSKKLTQAQLAEKIGMKQAAIARLESGQSNPRYSTVAKVADALDMRLTFVAK